MPMNRPLDAQPPKLTPTDVSLSAALGQQADLLRRFHDSCNSPMREVLSLCEWTIRPGNDNAFVRD
jgi:hypothetical protein